MRVLQVTTHINIGGIANYILTLSGSLKAKGVDVIVASSGGNLLIPQGTRVLGKYDSMISYGQKRVQVSWSRLIFLAQGSDESALLTAGDMCLFQRFAT